MPNTDWMGALSDDLYLPQLSIPGTHDSGSYQFTHVPMVRAQTLSISEQLAAGVRAFDIRCGVNWSGGYDVFHGQFNQGISVDSVVGDIVNFLAAHTGEVVLLLLKQETGMRDIANAVNALVNHGLGGTMFARPGLAQRWPRLGQCRGRALVLSRLGIQDASHYNTAGWPGNCLNGWVAAADHANYGVRIQDLWNNPSINDKQRAITVHLTRANTATVRGNSTELYFNFCSASWLLYEPVDTARDHLNPYLQRQFNAAGVIFVDAVTEALASHIIGWNPRSTRARHAALELGGPRPARRARRPSG